MKYKDKDYDNRAFYISTAWRKISAAYLSSRNYVCERCGQPAKICHHKKWLNGQNVNDPAIALSFDNLEALCIACHNEEHHVNEHTKVSFNAAGSIEAVKETRAAAEFLRQRDNIDKLLGALEEKQRCKSPVETL